MDINKQQEVQKLLHAAGNHRAKAVECIKKRQFQKAYLNFNLEARAADELADIMKEFYVPA